MDYFSQVCLTQIAKGMIKPRLLLRFKTPVSAAMGTWSHALKTPSATVAAQAQGAGGERGRGSEAFWLLEFW